MSHKGFSHIGLSTRDLDSTREFYEHVMGFEVVRCDIIKVAEGGQIRHIFFDTGRDQLIAFMEPQGVPGIPADYDAGINAGLGVPGSFYHFAFEAGSVAALEAKRQELLAKGVTVTDIVDHEWAHSIYVSRSQWHLAGVLLSDPGCRNGRRCHHAGACRMLGAGHAPALGLSA